MPLKVRKLRKTKPHNGQLCEFIIFVQIQLNVPCFWAYDWERQNQFNSIQHKKQNRKKRMEIFA